MALPLSEYRRAVDALFARTAGTMKFGLERTRALLATLGAPEARLRAFHVAGTNGKGSVCITLDRLLHARGLRVGRYTSPHLVDFRERITVDGASITEDEAIALLHIAQPAAERLGATFFEITTAIAFRHFADRAVDVAVIETGLGGRLDSTNVVDPLVAAVTSVGMDHMQYLGTSLESIAAEKAGIFKSRRPAIIGERSPEIAAYLAARALENGAGPVTLVRDDWRVSSVSVTPVGTSFTLASPAGRCGLTTPLLGEHQATNLATALAALDAAGSAYALPLERVTPALAGLAIAGRAQRVGRWIFDVAHNPAAARALAQVIRAGGLPQPAVAVLAVLADKDWRGVIDELAPVVNRFVMTRAPSAPAGRVWQPAAAERYARERGLDAATDESLESALGEAERAGGAALVTGSFHTVGDAMLLLRVPPASG